MLSCASSNKLMKANIKRSLKKMLNHKKGRLQQWQSVITPSTKLLFQALFIFIMF